MEDTTLHTKYRPQNLDDLIGHEDAVTRLKGMVKSGKVPGALLFVGPPSVGKTTLARALAASINGKPVSAQSTDFKDLNAADSKSIDDMRELIRISKFKPSGKRRVIVIDEAQALLSNGQAAAAILKPLEEAGKTEAIWILCSMDGTKFGSDKNGKAIAARCSQFVLEPHDNSALYKQGLRIVKGEAMSYLGKEELKLIVKNSNQDMRTLANLIQSIRDYYEGSDQKPEITEELVSTVIQSTESQDDKLVPQVIVGILTGKYAQVQKALLNVSDGFQFINKCLWAARFALNNAVLEGARHPKVWSGAVDKEIQSQIKGLKIPLGHFAALNECMVNIKAQSATFSVGETELMSARFYRLVLELFKKD
jgi:DNA polymerase III gamma/tau subunit